MSRQQDNSVKPSISSDQTSSQIDLELQKALYVGIELVGMLRHFHHDPRQFAQIRGEITAVAHWMNFLLAQREHITIEIDTQRPDLVKLGGRIVCERCRKSVKDNRNASAHKESAPPPIWKRQLEFLLACTNKVGAEIFEQGCSSSSLRRFPDCLAKLSNTLQRQRRYLASMGSGELRIEVEHCSDSCAECGQVINPLPVAVV
jgi:hypothetical protein